MFPRHSSFLEAERIRRLELENQRLLDTMQVCMEELATVSRAQLQVRMTPSTLIWWLTVSQGGEISLRKQPSFRWAPQGRAAQSPTRPTPEPVQESPRQSPHILEADLAVKTPLVSRHSCANGFSS
jgi:hypothetical protein